MAGFQAVTPAPSPAQSRIGPAAAASLAEKPELSTTVILMIAIPETMVILGFVVAVMILLRAAPV